MMRAMTRAAWTAAAALVITSGGPRAAKADVYLSLGDSVAFGETIFSPTATGGYADPSNGDRGFVGLYANDLAAKNGGVRPTVVNLAIDGETSTSFTSGSGRNNGGTGYSDAFIAQLNTHYTGTTPPTQAAQLASTLASQGSSIKEVTISLGSNDLFNLAMNDPNAAADLPAALQAFAARYAALVAQVHAGAPNAKIFLISSYNPYTALPSSPFAPLAAQAIPALDAAIAGVAAATGATYVDIFNTPLTTNAGTFTLINTNGDVHPNFDIGYRVITTQIEAAAVPEPSTVALMGVGAAGLAFVTRSARRRPRTSA